MANAEQAVQLQVGQLITGGPYGIRQIVTGITEEPDAAGVKSFVFGARGLERASGRKVDTLTEKNHQSRQTPEEILTSLPYHIGNVLTPDEIYQFKVEAVQEAARLKAEAAHQQAEADAHWDKTRAEAVKAGLQQMGKRSHHAQAAANIRKELKAAFPGVKFSVTSDSYAGGNSVSVHWDDGPTTTRVEAITWKYQEGSFDGMVDLYTANSERRFTEAYGGAQYVRTQRSHSDELQEALTTAYRVAVSCEGDNTWEVERQAWRLLNDASLPVGFTFSGLDDHRRIIGAEYHQD